MKKVLSLSEIISKKVAGYKLVIPILMGVFTAIMYCYLYINTAIDKNMTLANSISAHVSTLIETNDTPELMRFISAISKSSDSEIIVVHNGKRVAQTSSIQVKAQQGRSQIRWFDGFHSSRTIVKRSGGPQFNNSYIYLVSSIKDLLLSSMIVAITSFLLIFVFFQLYTRLIFSFVDKGLSSFPKMVRSLNNANSLELLEVTSSLEEDEYTLELQDFASSLTQTYKEIGANSEREVINKAHKLTIDAYKGLIHDLHTPIAALKQGAKIMKGSQFSEQIKQETVVRIAEITDQVLNQIKSSKENIVVNINPQIISLRKTVVDAIDQSLALRKTSVRIHCEFELKDSDTNISHDRPMLMRAISNLVVNAIDACQATIRLKVVKLNDEILISISDDGNGLELEKVSLYLQGRGESTKENGLGIGLASANHIVKLHGGKITYNQSDLGGANFDIRLQGIL